MTALAATTYDDHANDHGPSKDLLSFMVGDQAFAIDVMVVKEIRAFSPATKLPMSPDYMLGVVNLRGIVLPVLDLKTRLNVDGDPAAEKPVFIVISIRDCVFGLSVDAVSDILSVPIDSFQAPPSLGAPIDTFITHLLVHQTGIIRVLSPEKLLPNDPPRHEPSATEVRE